MKEKELISFLELIEVERASGIAPTHCTCTECNWSGKLSESETGVEQDGWEHPPYLVALCPKCNNELSGEDAFFGNENLMKISEYIKECHQTALEKGWWESDRTWQEIRMLIASEVFEAFEDYRADNMFFAALPENNRKPTGFPVEIADILVRIFDYTGKMGWNLLENRLDNPPCDDNVELVHLAAEYGTVRDEILLLDLLESMVRTLLCDRSKSPQRTCRTVFLTVLNIWYKCGWENFEDILQEKMAYNKTRSHRHGGKKI